MTPLGDDVGGPMTTPQVPAGPPALPEVDDFLDHVHAGDGATALHLVAQHMRSGGTVTEVVADLLVPVQRTVGERWHAARWTVADEHAASAVVEDALGVLAAHLPRSSGAERLTLVCAEGEWHVTPARMAALLLRDAGWHVDFLGGSTPADHLRAALEHARPGVLAVSATVPLALPGAATVIAVAHELGVPVLAGGAAFGAGDHRARRLGADGHAPDLATAVRTLREWLDHPPDRPPSGLDPELQDERGSLERQHDDLVESAFRLLGQRVPTMRTFADAQLEHTRRDLAYTLQFLQTALLVEDPGLFREYADWLRRLLGHRGIPADVVQTSFDALAEVLGPDRPASRSMLAANA